MSEAAAIGQAVVSVEMAEGVVASTRWYDEIISQIEILSRPESPVKAQQNFYTYLVGHGIMQPEDKALPMRQPAVAKTPGVAFARALRDLGLKQGSSLDRDFRIYGKYVGGERQYTFTVLHDKAARKVLDNAEAIVAAIMADGGWHVEVRDASTDKHTIAIVTN